MATAMVKKRKKTDASAETQGLKVRKAAEELLRRKIATGSLLEFVAYTKPDFEAMPYNKTICAYLDQWIAGEITRLIITMPPRHGKTELASRRMPAYILGRYPDAEIMLANYSGDLARKSNRDVQNLITSPRYARLFPDTCLADQFARTSAKFRYIRTSDDFQVVGKKGSLRSAGIGGGITGRGGHFIIVDDPVKNRAEADSTTYRQTVWDFFTSTLLTRLEPFLGKEGRVLIVLTRWHDYDLAGRCLKEQKGKWTLLNFPAIAPENPEPYDSRSPGEALWQSKFSLKALKAKREEIGLRDYEALYNGAPTVAEGTVFKREWFEERYETLPDNLLIVQSWDTGFKEREENDPSVCTTWGIGDNKLYLIQPITRLSSMLAPTSVF